MTPADIKRLTALPELRYLDVSMRSFNDEIFSHLRELPELRSLVLQRTPVRGSGFKDLGPDSKIQFLDLSFCSIQPEHLSDLSQLKHLNRIVLDSRGNRWSASSRQPIGLNPSPELIERVIEQTNDERGGVTDDAMKPLSKNCELRHISLRGTRVSAHGLKHLATMPHLESLDLSGTAVGDVGVKNLETSHVKKLILSECYLTDNAYESLEKMTSLEELELSGNYCRNEQLHRLQSLPNLKRLDLGHNYFSDENLSQLEGCQALTELKLTQTRVSFSALVSFCKRHPKLSPIQCLTDAGFATVDSESTIRGIHLKAHSLTPQIQEFLKDYPTIRWLDLSYTKVTDDQLKCLLDLPELTNVNLSGTNVTDEVWVTLSQLPDLVSVDTQHTKISLASLRRFLCDQQKIPLSRVLDDNHALDARTDNNKAISVNVLHRNVADADMQSLSSLPDLYCLKVAGNELTPQGIIQISSDSAMKILWISGPCINGASLAHLSQLKQLEILAMTDATIASSDLQALKDFPKLQTLNLSGCCLDSAAVPQLLGLPHLETLLVDHQTFSQPDLERLRGRSNLELIVGCQPLAHKIKKRSERYVSRSYQSGGDELRLPDPQHPLEKIFGREFLTTPTSLYIDDSIDLSKLIGLNSLEDISMSECDVLPKSLIHLRQLPNLKSIYLGRTWLPPGEISDLSGSDVLESLNLHRSDVTSEDLSKLKELPRLKELFLGGYSNSLSADFLLGLADFPSLEVLEMDRSPIANETMSELLRYPKLTRLSLRECKISHGIRQLANLKYLKQLDLTYTYMTDTDLEALESMNLERLAIGQTYVSPAGVERFKQRSPKTQLDAKGVLDQATLDLIEPFRAAGAYVGRSQNSIYQLNFAVAKQNPNDLEFLSKFPALSKITVKGDISDDLCEYLSGLAQFRELTMHDGKVNRKLLESLSHLEDFRELTLFRCDITSDAWEQLLKLQQLHRLTLYQCSRAGALLSDQNLVGLESLSSLQYLRLSHTQVGDEAIGRLKLLPSLKTLNISATRVTDEGLYPLESWPGLRTVYAEDTQITPQRSSSVGEGVYTKPSR